MVVSCIQGEHSFNRRRSEGREEACSVGCGKSRDSEGGKEPVGESEEASEESR